ncbi:hypothetical protein NQ315_001621 [Exocentrus adspersus]|uniref:DNA 3'-5' helicase n=1 Tax=Exocentrus adspersus TaxID=1586481 RepID=A0AAV8W9D6_9CUCU|nr:hypothetical protein NQ315_001621 [Exocentrus adspersus]
MDNFRSIDDIPSPYRNIFTEYPCFNAVQSQVLDDILYTDNSVVVSAPTGSGKTAIFELAVVRLLIQYENLDVSKIKIIYICPIKALCHEKLIDWHKKFSPFGLNSVAATGDSDNMDFQHLANYNLIISTPEKWDSLTRRWRDNEKVVQVVKLFMIDEVHLLNEEDRGSTLEVIVCRMKTVENCLSYCANENNVFNQKIRFIAVSATVPNVEDIAEWIGKTPHIKFYRFSEEMRPVKLKKIIYGYNYNPKTSPFKFDISLNYKLPSLMMQYSEGKPTLIFCSTRKSVEMTANHLVHSLKIHLNEEQRQKLLDVANMITDSKAKITVKHGVGYHHAGMIHETRHAIENLFRNGDLPVLVTTSTLAMGVNLPAHLVIVKSTKCYDNGGFRDYTETAIHQMIGRAGRPQFDTSATALILTSNEDKPKFEKMVGCGQPIESNLHRHLTEHLNAEIVLRTITGLDVAMQWLSSTFLYVRAKKNPYHYGIRGGFTQNQIDKKLLEICQIDLNKLVKTGMITMDQNIVITPTVTGKIMAKYYVDFETMKLFTQISGTEILIQILALISKCREFAPMRLRVNDKKTLNLLNKNSSKDTIRFPLNGRIKTWDMKVNCIIQAVLGNLDILDHSILTESLTIMRNGERIAKCLIEYLETRRPNCYSALLNTIILGKCFHARLWENSPYVSKQLSGIGSVMSNQLANAGKTTFKKIMESNPRDIELV